MKLFAIRRVWRAGWLLQTMLAVAGFTSCETIYDGEGDCAVTYQVDFRYTKNILEADAFANQVKSVSLFVYDPSGRLVTSRSEAGDALQADRYTMTLNVAPGTYDLVAWAGLEGNASFSLNGGAAPATLQEARVLLARESAAEGAVSRQQLAPVFHAFAQGVVFPDTYGEAKVATLDLTKNTNTLRVILTHYNGSELNPDEFTFTVADNNGFYNYDNSLLGNETIRYHEWTKKALPSFSIASRADAGDVVNSLSAELSLARLMADHESRLTIHSSGKEIVSLPLTDLLLHAKGEARSAMSNQEYLDRQDEYTLVFFINDDNGWYTAGGIYINGWHMRIQETEM